MKRRVLGKRSDAEPVGQKARLQERLFRFTRILVEPRCDLCVCGNLQIEATRQNDFVNYDSLVEHEPLQSKFDRLAVNRVAGTVGSFGSVECGELEDLRSDAEKIDFTRVAHSCLVVRDRDELQVNVDLGARFFVDVLLEVAPQQQVDVRLLSRDSFHCAAN